MKKHKSVNDMFLDWAKKNNVDEKPARKLLETRKVSHDNWELTQNAIRIQNAKRR